jgi:hypothetical protein
MSGTFGTSASRLANQPDVDAVLLDLEACLRAPPQLRTAPAATAMRTPEVWHWLMAGRRADLGPPRLVQL